MGGRAGRRAAHPARAARRWLSRRLVRKRADLDALATLLTSESRRLNVRPPPLSAIISHALYPADPILTGADRGLAATDWQAAYAALCEAPTD
jgi:hypothetical protein